MSGGAPGVGSLGRSRRKSLDAEINLVPFIDLLSMCICFLLMTAIWIEVGALPIKQMLGTLAAEEKLTLDFEVSFKKPGEIELKVLQQNRVVQAQVFSGETPEVMTGRLSGYMASFTSALATQTQQPSLSARVIPTKTVNYGEMVAVLDVFKGYGISSLAVIPVKE